MNRTETSLIQLEAALMKKHVYSFSSMLIQFSSATVLMSQTTLLEEKVLYRTLKGSISAMYLEPLKGSIHS